MTRSLGRASIWRGQSVARRLDSGYGIIRGKAVVPQGPAALSSTRTRRRGDDELRGRVTIAPLWYHGPRSDTPAIVHGGGPSGSTQHAHPEQRQPSDRSLQRGSTESADIEAGVSVGAGTSIWYRAQVRNGAQVGADCVIGRDAFIDEQVVIGDRVKIQNAALVYHGVTVEDGVFIGPNAILTNDRFPRAITADGRLARAEDWTVSPIRLRTGASIGAGAVVVAGNDVGRFATVGAGAVVTRTCPTMRSSPATPRAASAGSARAAIVWPTQRARRSPPTHRADATCTGCGLAYGIDDGSCVRVGSQAAR